MRLGCTLKNFMIKSMLAHAVEHGLPDKLSKKWKLDSEEIDNNIEDLAKRLEEPF